MILDSHVRGQMDDLLADAFMHRSSRRTLMQRALVLGGAAGLAYVFPRAVVAQDASPAAGGEQPGVHMEAYDGDLASDQLMRISMTEPKTMDPGVSTGYDELEIFFNIFEGLTGVDVSTGEVVSRCAESWEPNDDATAYTFTLRDDLKWSNGNPIVAGDFEYAWKRVMNPETLSLYRPAMYPIKNALAIDDEDDPLDYNELGVTAIDDHTLEVAMEAPCPFFPLLTSTWTFSPVPKDAIDANGDQWVEAENIVSNGPYKMTAWEHDQSITLELNDQYYGETPTITRAEYMIFEDDSTQQYAAFENGELDFCWPASADVERAMGDEELSQNLYSFVQSNCRMITCDAKTSPTDNADLRRAIYAAIDRETVANVIMKKTAVPALNVLPLDIPGNNPEATNPVGEEAAKAAMEASGLDPATIELEYSYRVSGDLKTIAEYFQQRLPEVLGIKVKLNPVDAATYAEYNSSRKDQPFNLKYGTWGSDFADPSNWHNQNFVSTSDHYYTSWVNEEYDALCADASSETDPATREQMYRDAEVMLVEDAVYIPVYRGVAYLAIQPWVKNFHIQPILAFVHLRNLKIAPQ